MLYLSPQKASSLSAYRFLSSTFGELPLIPKRSDIKKLSALAAASTDREVHDAYESFRAGLAVQKFDAFCGELREYIKAEIAAGKDVSFRPTLHHPLLWTDRLSAFEALPIDGALVQTPRDIKTALDKFVIGQDRAKKILSVAAYDHFLRINDPSSSLRRAKMKDLPADHVELKKMNVMLQGPTGTGKTYVVETLARILDVPFVAFDATTLSGAGYVGADVQDIIARLYAASGRNLDATQKGIVYIDEIDKIASNPGASNDVSGTEVQQALLKMFEDADVEIKPDGQHGASLIVNTGNIWFICGGAFSGIEKVIQERIESANTVSTSKVGFGATLRAPGDKVVVKRAQAETEDFMTMGMIPEFMGRIGVTADLEEHSIESMMRIFTEPQNALAKQYAKRGQLSGKTLTFEPEAVAAIAEEAIARGTGARGLKNITDAMLTDTMFELPDLKEIDSITVSREFVTRYLSGDLDARPEMFDSKLS